MSLILFASGFLNVIFFLLLAYILIFQVSPENQEKKLREREEKWKSLFKILPVGVSILDSNYRIKEINSALTKITGMTENGLIQGLYKKRKYLKMDKTLLSQDDFPSARAIKEQREIMNVQIGVIKEDGEIVWTDVSAAPLPFKDETCVVVTANITGRINAEEALRKGEERFRLFIKSSPLGILMTKPTGEILSANPACCKILQMTEEEVCQGGRDGIVDITDPRLTLALKERQEHGEIHAKRITMKRKNGEKFEAEISSVIFEDIEGNQMTSMVLDDISHRKQLEEELAESKERLQNIIELIHEGVSVTDEQGKIIIWNIFTEKLTGISASEAIDRYIWDIQFQMMGEKLRSPEIYENLKKSLIDFLKTGQAQWANHELVREYIHPNGLALSLLGRVSSIPTSRGFMLVATQQDITERKKMQDALSISEEQFRTLIHNLQIGIVLQGPGSEVILSNPKALSLLGLTEDQLLGKTSMDPYWNIIHEDGSVFHPEDRAVQVALRSRKAVGDIVMGVLRPANNDMVWLMVNADPQLDETGNVKQVITTFIDITERFEMEKKIRQLADYDQLTQLPNRRLLDDRLNHAMAVSKRTNCYGAILFLDLDNFKPLNDRYGHTVGDMLLAEVAVRLKNCVRESDTVARFGGDEFVVMLDQLDETRLKSEEEAITIAEKIRKSIASPFILSVGKGEDSGKTIEHDCAASIGIALFINHEASPEDIIKWADSAMYKSKEEGRNRISLYEPG
jgi:diguanylate cyclase (GGDEF)-like protein/PAS domain S-box-containing protein